VFTARYELGVFTQFRLVLFLRCVMNAQMKSRPAYKEFIIDDWVRFFMLQC
jgi:hypothetical protein